MLLQNPDDLLFAESALLHSSTPIRNRLTSKRGHFRGAGQTSKTNASAFFQAAQFRAADGEIWVDKYLLPMRVDRLPTLLISLQVFERTSIQDRHWKLSAPYLKQAIALIRSHNKLLATHPISLAELDKWNDAKRQAGQQAEIWALNYERKRLAEHPLADQICLISETDVSAGFDLMSFESLSSAQFDRFIEVKSYSQKKEFFWSRNEVQTSSILREKYVIYLVDRTQMIQSDYVPVAVHNPYKNLIENSSNGEWNFVPDGYHLTPA